MIIDNEIMNPEREEFRVFFPGIKKEEDMSDEVLIDERTGFSIRVKKIATKAVLLRHQLERCYDWTNLKLLILRDLKNFYDSSTIRDFFHFKHHLVMNISSWLHTFSGWGLKYYLLGELQEATRMVLLAALSFGLPEFKKFSELDPESTVKSFFDIFKVLKMDNEIKQRIDACDSLLWGPSNDNQWRKILKIKFSTLWNFADSVHVEFEIEKIQPSMSLVDLAVEVAAKDFYQKFKDRVLERYRRYYPLPFKFTCTELPINLQILVKYKILDFRWKTFMMRKKSESPLESEDILESMLPQFLFL